HSREVSFLPWGAAYNRVPADATAFAHRGELFLVQHLAGIKAGASWAAGGGARDWLARSWGIVHPSGSRGVYPHFPGPGPPGLGSRLLRRELRSAAARQGTVRPGHLLPPPPVAAGSRPGEVSRAADRLAPVKAGADRPPAGRGHWAAGM